MRQRGGSLTWPGAGRTLIAWALLAGCRAVEPPGALEAPAPVMSLTGVELSDFGREGRRWRATAREVSLSADLSRVGIEGLAVRESPYGVRLEGERAQVDLGARAVSAAPVAARLEQPSELAGGLAGARQDTSAVGEAVVRGLVGDGAGSKSSGPTPEGWRELPVDITADRFLGRGRDGRGSFEGHVVVVRGPLRLTCERLTVEYDRDTQRVTQLAAHGEVRIEAGKRKSRAERVTFDQRARRIILEGRPMLEDGPDEMRGERIVWDLETDQVACERCRVRLGSERSAGGGR